MTHNSIWIDWFKPSPWHSCFKLGPSRDMIYHKPIRRASDGPRTSSKFTEAICCQWMEVGIFLCRVALLAWMWLCGLQLHFVGGPQGCSFMCVVFVNFPPILWHCWSVYFWAAGCCRAGMCLRYIVREACCQLSVNLCVYAGEFRCLQ